jgi:murein DD-endopeptidase MepM/ murein hydrolase activator NlpD
MFWNDSCINKGRTITAMVGGAMLDPIYVFTEDPQYFKITYDGDATRQQTLAAQWQKFSRTDPATAKSLKIWCRPTAPSTQVMVDYLLNPSAPAGRYRIETFVPALHATTRNAIFAVASNFRSQNSQTIHDEPLTVVDMNEQYDVWYPLGEFDLDPGNNPLSGRVRQFDLSREDPVREVAFGPVRWSPVAAAAAGGLQYDAPVGSREERAAPLADAPMFAKKYPTWAGTWFDFNPFLSWYEQGWHTGADLNLPGANTADRGKPVYAAADGVVTFAGKASSWGHLIVIEHPDAQVSLPDGGSQRQKVYTRYGHIDARMLVKAGQPVTRGQNIGFIGQASGSVAGWHLHFDVSYSDLLLRQPAHWPSLATLHAIQASNAERDGREYRAAQMALKKEVLRHYLDPLRFLQENHGVG